MNRTVLQINYHAQHNGNIQMKNSLPYPFSNCSKNVAPKIRFPDILYEVEFSVYQSIQYFLYPFDTKLAEMHRYRICGRSEEHYTTLLTENEVSSSSPKQR